MKDNATNTIGQKTTEKMVKVRINITSLKPEFDISLGCAEFEDMTDEEIARRPHINVARERSKMLNNLLMPGTEIEVPESIAKKWEAEKYEAPTGIFGVINASQLGIAPPKLLDEMKLGEFYQQLDEFGQLVHDKISVQISRATIIG